ncbi:MAG: ShlB/FhaC/HecB family hemolysin secretion/activation protein [Sphingomonas sp.]|nr:ShlB/FhaC/HecB family hemolysin secretion/activation protein [Sphingomonas sp.]
MPVPAISKWLLALSATVFTPFAAQAQSDTGSIERTIPKFEIRQTEKQARVAAPATSPDAGARIAGTFVLGAVNIEGATVFGSDELAKSFEPYLASQVGPAELDKIMASLTDRYRSAGYLLSYATLPEQSVQSGIVRVRIVEGYVDEVVVDGGGRSAAQAKTIADRLRSDRPLRSSTLERTLGLIRDIPGLIVSDVQISRSPRDSTRHKLTLILKSDRVRGFGYMDNRGTIDGARMRGYSSVSLASLAEPGDQLQLDLFTIPSDNFRFFYGQAKATIPIGPDGLRFSLSASRGDQFQRLPGPNQHGKSRQMIADLAFPFAKSRVFSAAGHFSIGDWNSEEKRAGLRIQHDRLQVARAWVEFSKAAKTRIDGRIGISQGLDLDSATERDDPLGSRPFGSGKFTKFNADVHIATAFSERVFARLDTSAQYSTKALLAPEEYALGGGRIGRAFDFNELTGDHGIGAMAEISYRTGPKSLELLAFVDGGGAFRKRPSPGFPDDQWLASAGVGARFSVGGLLWAGEVGVPVARSNVDRGVRAFFSVTKAF